MGSISGSGFISRGRFGDHFGAGDHFRVAIISRAVQTFLNHKRLLLKGSSSYYAKWSGLFLFFLDKF